MTIREILGWTKHMGPFEISIAWALIPESVKKQLPSDFVNAMNNLATVIITYKVVLTAYNAAKKSLDDATKVTLALVPGSTTAPAFVATETAKATTSNVQTNIFSQFNPINTILDTQIPGT